MRFITSHLNLLFIICWFPLRHAQEIDSVWFPADNFTYCNGGEFQVYSVNRYFDLEKSVYNFNFTSSSNINVTNLNGQETSKSPTLFYTYLLCIHCYFLSIAYSSSRMVLKFGFKTMEPESRQFCLDSIERCPLLPKTNFTIERVNTGKKEYVT